MDANLAGLVALGALILGLFAWLRQDIRTLRDEMRSEIGGLRGKMNELRDRVARIEGLLEAIFMRRDLSPLPDPPAPGGPPSKPEAA